MQFPYVMDNNMFYTCLQECRWAKLGPHLKQLWIHYFQLLGNVFETKLEGIGYC
jgi:hypothetical protein